jgi:DNA-binding NtrC family response regulator
MKASLPLPVSAGARGDERNARPPTILLVDDQPIILRALRRVFRSEGYSILSAGSGEEALALLEREDCDLIISDYLMPEINGIELIGRVKEIRPGLPCILLTGHADFDIVSRVIRGGLLCKFALKPWNDSDLRKAVADALAAVRRDRAAPPEGVSD